MEGVPMWPTDRLHDPINFRWEKGYAGPGLDLWAGCDLGLLRGLAALIQQLVMLISPVTRMSLG